LEPVAFAETLSKRNVSPLRQLLFSGVTVAALLFLTNLLVEFGDEAGVIATRSRDDAVQYLDAPLFTRAGDYFQNFDSEYEECPKARFRVDKGDTFRIFLHGGSFAMGSPWVDQTRVNQQEGGIAHTLRRTLSGERRPVEVINVALGGQNSNRVRASVAEVLNYAPDLIVVATCNNEGALPPSKVEAQLHRYGLYRWIALGVHAIAPNEPSMYTPQDPDTVAVREAFQDNIRGIIRHAQGAGVPLLLAALPVNLQYRGTESGHLIAGHRFSPVDIPPCLAELENLLDSGNFRRVEELAPSCSSVMSMTLYAQALLEMGRPDDALKVLEQTTELTPRNRCRPSYNAIIRAEAARAEGVYLVDLDAHARALSPHGIPGQNLFIDSCHMSKEGYALMAEEILRVARAHDLLPK